MPANFMLLDALLSLLSIHVTHFLIFIGDYSIRVFDLFCNENYQTVKILNHAAIVYQVSIMLKIIYAQPGPSLR